MLQNLNICTTYAKKIKRMKKIDKWDKRIIYEFDNNGRASISDIAKRISKSKSFVSYRLENYIKEKIFIDYIAVIDVSKLGFQTYDIFLQVLDRKNEEKIIKFLLEKSEINCIQRIIGKYQLYISIFVKSSVELEEFFFEIVKKFERALQDYQILLIYKAYSPAHNFIFANDISRIEHNKPILNSKHIKLTDIEIKVLNIIGKDPKRSFNNIAIELNSTISKIKQTYSSLISKDVLLYVRPSINARKLGYLHKNILIRLKLHSLIRIDDIKDYFQKLNSTIFLSYTFGQYNLTGEFVFKDLDDFMNFQENTLEKFGKYIDIMESHDYFEELRYSHSPEINKERYNESSPNL